MRGTEQQEIRRHPIRKDRIRQVEQFGLYSVSNSEHLHTFKEEINESKIKVFLLGRQFFQFPSKKRLKNYHQYCLLII